VDFIIFDKEIKIDIGNVDMGQVISNDGLGIRINTMSRTITLKSYSLFDLLIWTNGISSALINCPFVQINKFLSFAPIRKKNAVKTYINGLEGGDEYFSDVFDAFEKAQYEIFITDWMLSPELYLKRPKTKFPQTR